MSPKEHVRAVYEEVAVRSAADAILARGTRLGPTAMEMLVANIRNECNVRYAYDYTASLKNVGNDDAVAAIFLSGAVQVGRVAASQIALIDG